MKYYLIPQIEINVCFSDEEFELLDEAINNSEYKFEALDQSGFWNIFSRIRKNFSDVDSPRVFTFRQLDKLTKCLEPYCMFVPEKVFLATKITNKIFKILTDVNSKSSELNNQFSNEIIEL